MDGGSGPSTPRGDAELVDFDELERLECQRGAEEVKRKEREEAMLVQAAALQNSDADDEQHACHESGGLPAGERLSGPKQWERWFSTEGDHALQKETSERQNFQEYIQEREWELTVNGPHLENDLAQLLQKYEQQETCEQGSIRGALATVSDATAGKGSERRCFVADAVNEVLLELHKLLADKERLAAAGALVLDVRVSTLEFLLSMALPCSFQEQPGSAVLEDLVRQLRAPRSGLCSLVRKRLDALAKPGSKDALHAASIDARFQKLAQTLRKLLDLLQRGANADAAFWAETAYEWTSWALTTSDPAAWPEPVGTFKTAVGRVCNHSPGRGRGAVIRTSAREITLLLHELRTKFKAQDFQARYHEVKAKAQHGDRKTHGQMVDMIWAVQKSVLPKYGFEASPHGVLAMYDESDFFADHVQLRNGGDKVVAWLRLNVMEALEVKIEQDWNHGGQKFAHAPQFHTVGDSHSTVGWPDYVNRHFQGPLLCYNVTRVDVRNLKPPVQPGDALCFCLGEIDCRVQVHKRIGVDGATYQEVIDRIIKRYFQHLRLQEGLLPAGVRVLVFNVPPPQYRSVLEHSWIGIPCKGEDEERRGYVLYFNQRLKEECYRNGFEFFDVYDKYTDERGFLDAKYSDSTIHISDGAALDEFIKGLRLKAVRKDQVKLGGDRE